MSWNLTLSSLPPQTVRFFQNTHQAVAPYLPLSMQPHTGGEQNRSQSWLYENSLQHFQKGALPYVGDPVPQTDTGLYYQTLAFQQNFRRIEQQNLEILKLLAKLLASQNPASSDKFRLDHVG